MRLTVHVKPNAKRVEITKQGEELHVSLRAKPADNKANRELIHVLAEHFNVPTSCVHIVSGIKSRKKIIEVL
ncbi:MAG: DUF167 domain-containing protein [Candidatus Aenigmarchaeota archaeon]|nr:DUF167 domain-containing protein [Candidatus Aenigmarchaeota archaeon]